MQLLDRKQQKLELVLLSIDNFCEPPPNTYNTENHFTPTSASVQVIYSEQSPIWINVNDLLYFLKSDDANEVKFIWGSEESEFRHLYLITSSIAGLITILFSIISFARGFVYVTRISQALATAWKNLWIEWIAYIFDRASHPK